MNNQIETLPTYEMDEDMRLEAYARIYNTPRLSRYNLCPQHFLYFRPLRHRFSLSFRNHIFKI